MVCQRFLSLTLNSLDELPHDVAVQEQLASRIAAVAPARGESGSTVGVGKMIRWRGVREMQLRGYCNRG